LAGLDGIESPGDLAQPTPGRLDPARAATNFVVFRVRRARSAFLDALRARGILMVEYSHGTIRAVTHYGVTAADVERVLTASADALRETTAIPELASASAAPAARAEAASAPSMER
jgi:threonine aldolase